jgi:hypothetical protein
MMSVHAFFAICEEYRSILSFLSEIISEEATPVGAKIVLSPLTRSLLSATSDLAIGPSSIDFMQTG